jgi:hypothetical protein
VVRDSERTAEDGGETAMADAEPQLEGEPRKIDPCATTAE